MNKYAELFVTESRDYLTAMEHALLQLEADPQAREPIDALFRSVHTLKGMSGVMGYSTVTELSHAMETRLARVRAEEESLGPGTIDMLFEAADALARAVEVATEGRPTALDVASLVRRLAGAGEPGAPSAVSPAMPELLLAGLPVRIQLEPDAPLPGARARIITDKLRTVGTVHGTQPADAALWAEGFDGRFTVFIETTEDDETIRELVCGCGDVREVRISAPASPRTAGNATADDAWATRDLKAPLQRYVRIELRRLDHLLDLVGELVTVRGRLQVLAAAHEDGALDETVAKAARLIGELQDGVLGSRMVPVWQVFDRFPRVVRDAARLVGKDVALTLEGREIELDRTLLEQVADPLVHLLRNAVDHGIEAPDARRAAGKPSVGRIKLIARRERSAVVIVVADDGRGVDRLRILTTARSRGWVPETTEELSDDDVLRLISRPGFSTAERVSEVSGRGVGIDAVLAKVRALGGTVVFSTVEGRGTVFELRLPVTLAIVPTVITRVGDESYALPLTHVTETLQPAAGAVRPLRGRQVFVLRNEVLPLLSLRQLVGLPVRDVMGQQIVIVEVTDRRAAIAVDRLDGQQDIVVKAFDAAKDAIACTGAAILSDGSASLILDVGGLLQEH
ncbi:MAG: chemotaxis protein CheA [Gemmatimonadaceae bacterium]|nr:chemotaxis protein CheA [Gemmatimonadaceae bacterium]